MDLQDGWRVRDLDDEPVYCEAPQDPSDVLYPGSDDEHYDKPEDRRRRCEEAALRFLSGHTPILLSAVLRGPFEGPEAKGWVNPWRSKRETATAALPSASAPASAPASIYVPDTDSVTSCHLPSPQSLDQVADATHPFMEDEDLERVQSWCSATNHLNNDGEETWSQEVETPQSQRKRRAIKVYEDRQKDNKRRKTDDSGLVEESLTLPQHRTPSPRPNRSQSFSEQLKQDVDMVDDNAQSLQSPETPSPRRSKQAQAGGDSSPVDPSCQSPWATSPSMIRWVAQEALMTRSSNTARAISTSPLVSAAVTQPDTPQVEPTGELGPLAAVERSRPATPEPVFSIKSFANFMSPSPERARRRPKKIRLSDGHLPSTQNLIAATTDNPWDSASKSAKRVRWALLPHDVEGNGKTDNVGPQTPVASRSFSPPPETAVNDLPMGDDDVFRQHFRAVSGRTDARRHLLPSASQQVLDSPTPMAMAEAFVVADSLKRNTLPGPDVTTSVDDTLGVTTNSTTQESVIDDVDDVLRNLNEFIEMCDIEADLERAKNEQMEKEKQQQQRGRSAETTSRLGNFGFDDTMDTGVWS
ncbi:hypothetical protein CCHL11_03818 [Colletotrichum chlorophyti]|uniref:Protamine P1 n=1 Tax=Colletotrichum chlorophyti TaxID=708187 RepID=A0A1Q8RQU3_9PEZI|nr:hypothetical protein CCHL11_03818 [Colletotrichum chlorophyti]